MPLVHSATNEISQTISDAFLREKYGITKEYEKNHPEDSALALLVVRSTEEALQAARESAQSSKKLTNSITELEKSSKELHTRLDSVIESSKKNTQALRELADSSSELKEMTSNIANFAKRFFNPVRNGVRNGFYFLTRHRVPSELTAVLPRENPLAIEDNPENTISIIDPINQSSVDEKKTLQAYSYFLRFRAGYTFCMRASKETSDIHL